MAYKTIVAHLSAEHRARHLLGAAIALAKAQGAHLIGLAVLPPIIVVPGAEGMPGDVVEEHRTLYTSEIERMRAIFSEMTAGSGLSSELQVLDGQVQNPFGDVASILVQRVRAADLTIASQANPDWHLSAYLDVIEPLVLESGRPVLVMPKASRHDNVGRHILVAYNGRREATRALWDALPLLAGAERVTLAWVDPETDAQAAKGAAAAEMAGALARHGVRCEEASPTGAAAGAGAALLTAAESHGCDMLVMGCYGHSRLREFIFGGATRHVLQHMTIPVLMSH